MTEALFVMAVVGIAAWAAVHVGDRDMDDYDLHKWWQDK